MKLFKICILICLCILIFTGCEKSNEGRARNMLFGKNITIMVAEDEVVDAAYLKKY